MTAQLSVSRLSYFVAASLALGCASSAHKDTTPKSATAADGGGASASCEKFTAELCQSLGTDTEPCASLRNIGEWLPAKACDAALTEMPSALAKVKALRADCDTLTAKLCTDLGKDSEGCTEVTHDMPQVPAGHCRALLAHYPELVAQLQERNARGKPMSAEQWGSLLAGTPPSIGPDAAKVTIVEFSDFQCPYCAQASETVKQIRTQYADKVRVVFRQFPLSFHEHAHMAAEAAVAAQTQGKFWQMHDALFEHQSALDRESLERYAQEQGLDVKLFKKSLDDKAGDAQIDADVALGRAVHVDGTPTMFLNGKRVDNPTQFEEVQPLIEAALSGK